ncbi:glycosyltransferase family 4 protein [Escherichia coli]|uniref:glycosyltransferase family 4 protein n=1 Tax=Escherichia coli TaxID=562 RepID=UPI0017A755A7|nr:glycosyltransferase family 1 protein [Escherichia coli]EFI1494865.1 glycosyltransferase family 4 protein [Escherichia coli]HCP5982599.1 glycosyltransferase family 4 protein [Escherichia coli]
MNILLDCRLISNRPTGISRYSEKMLEYYIDKYGMDNIHALVNQKSDKIKCKQIVTTLKPFNIVHWLIFPLWLKKNNYHWIISFHYSGIAYRIENVNSVITVHDLMFELVPNFFNTTLKNLIGKLYYRIIVKKSIMNSDITISVSETTRNDILRLYKKDSKISGEGIFLQAKSDESLLMKYNLESNNYFLYIGNNRPHKNIDFLKKCFQDAKLKNNLNCKLVLVGHAGQSDDDIIYPGILSDEQIVGLYRNAKAFVFPSKYEGFGLPILEALDNKCPVVASDIPAFREFSNSNITYFKLGDKAALADVFNRDYKFDDAEAQEVINRYSWPQTYKNLDRIFGGLI